MTNQKQAGVPWPWDEHGNWSADWLRYLNKEAEHKAIAQRLENTVIVCLIQ